MCGIFALISLSNFNVDLNKVKKVLHHRGPDSVGEKVINCPKTNTKVTLVHTRLKINGNSNDEVLY